MFCAQFKWTDMFWVRVSVCECVCVRVSVCVRVCVWVCVCYNA